MAQTFSPKNYFKKIQSLALLTELYKRNDVVAIFEITEQTPRKNVISILTDFYNALPPEVKIEVTKELAVASSLSTKCAPPLFAALLAKNGTASDETQIECVTDHDKALYHYLFNKEMFDEAFFFHDFYLNRGYMLYEANEVDEKAADFAMTELQKEFTRIANKEDNATECDFEHKLLDGILYVAMSFDGGSVLETKKDPATGEIDRASTRRKKELVKIAYLPKEKEVLVSYTGSRYEKLIYLDTFLRIVCKGGYTGKEESFNLNAFNDETFDFTKTNKGIPLLTWKIKGITLSFGEEKNKKKMKLSLPSSSVEYGLYPLNSTLKELSIEDKRKEYSVENVMLSFSFTNSLRADKSVSVSCNLSTSKSSLCPLFPYDRLARALLKQAGIELGFVEPAAKEKEDVAKKWES